MIGKRNNAENCLWLNDWNQRRILILGIPQMFRRGNCQPAVYYTQVLTWARTWAIRSQSLRADSPSGRPI